MISVLTDESEEKDSTTLSVIFSFVIDHRKENLTSLCKKEVQS